MLQSPHHLNQVLRRRRRFLRCARERFLRGARGRFLRGARGRFLRLRLRRLWCRTKIRLRRR